MRSNLASGMNGATIIRTWFLVLPAENRKCVVTAAAGGFGLIIALTVDVQIVAPKNATTKGVSEMPPSATQDDDFLGQSLEEVERPAPINPRSITGGWAELVKPLAGRIAALGDGKCIRIKKAIAEPLIAALRQQTLNLGYRLIYRTMPGETYFWRGEALVGTKKNLADLRSKEE